MFIWDFDQTEAIRASAIKSLLIHDSEEGSHFRWIVYAIDYDDNLLTLLLINSEESARKFAESVIDKMDTMGKSQ